MEQFNRMERTKLSIKGERTTDCHCVDYTRIAKSFGRVLPTLVFCKSPELRFLNLIGFGIAVMDIKSVISGSTGDILLAQQNKSWGLDHLSVMRRKRRLG